MARKYIEVVEIEGRKTRQSCFDCANKEAETAVSPLLCLAEWGGMDCGQPVTPPEDFRDRGRLPTVGTCLEVVRENRQMFGGFFFFFL